MIVLFNGAFFVGNKETLLEIPKQRGQDARDELLKFHSKYYSSNIMAVSVLGKGKDMMPVSLTHSTVNIKDSF